MTAPSGTPVRPVTENRPPASATNGGPGPRDATRIGFWTVALHLGALWALAFAQPLFGLLGDSAEFFVARGNTTSDIVLFAIAYGLVPPLVCAVVVWAAGLIHSSLGWAIHLMLIASLVAALVLPPLGDALSGSAASVAVAVTVGIVVALLYAYKRFVQTFLTLLSPTPLIFIALFLVFSPVADLVWPREASGVVVGPSRSSTPIVHVILDELPATTLEGPDGRFESRLFPNLARFVQGATWYRNATTVADSTPDAIPAQVTGDRPHTGELPTTRDHPRSLFTLFGRSHDITAVEPLTDVCPAQLCVESRPAGEARLQALARDLRVIAEHLLLPGDLREGLPPIDQSWEGFQDESEGAPESEAEARAGRKELMQGVLARLGRNDARAGFERTTSALGRIHDRSPLLFLHSTLPHLPWRYLPDGRVYVLRGGGYARPGGRWENRQWLIDQAFQRHILQVQYVDAMLGRLLRRIRTSGIYDSAVIVVTADHGASFRAGQLRRALNAANMAEIAPVPFFVKYPGQREGRVSDRAVRTIDVLPTIAKAAGVRVPWKTDGMPADQRPLSASSRIDITHAGAPGQTQSLSRLLAARRERDLHEAQILRHGLFALGPRPDLVGLPIAAAAARAGTSATIDGAWRYGKIASDAPVAPVYVSGEVRGLRESTAIAIAVNGRIESTTNLVPRGERLKYTGLVRPSSLHPGSNRITVLAVLPDGLRTIASAG